MWTFLPDFILRNTAKTKGEHDIKWEGKIFLEFDYTDNLSVLDTNVNGMNDLSEVLRVWNARIGTKIIVKKTKSLRLEINEGKEVVLERLRYIC